MENDLKLKFEMEITENNLLLNKYTRAFNLFGYIKIFALAIFVIVVYFLFSQNFAAVYWAAAGFLTGAQIILWIYHAYVHDKMDYHKSIIDINNKYIERINGGWINFSDTGSEFADREHIYASDLDITGKKSLFQMLNVANTWHGRKAFARDLMFADYKNEELRRRQEAVSELSSDIKFCAKVQHYTSKIGAGENINELISQLSTETKFINSNILKIILTYFPVLSFLFIAAVAIFQIKGLYIAAFIIAVAQCFVWIAGIPRIYSYLGAAAGYPYKLGGYVKVMEILQNKSFKSAKLNETKHRLVSSGYSAAKAVKELYRIVNRINMKHNAAFYFILNIFLLWDYECAFMLEKWKKKYGGSVPDWFEALGEFESLMSLSAMSNICTCTCFPTESETPKTIESTEQGHPLIPNSTRVYNDFNMRGGIIIISGSNMSGKTTFLRTIGINLVLSKAGGCVCAKSFNYTPFEIVTSMRIADDLTEGISTFYAELKRIKKIVERACVNNNTLFLIDEIFRGTNSVDRMYGAKTVLEKFDTLNVSGMITTHDLELCRLADEHTAIKNYSFSEYYANNAIHFDYKIKSGKSVTTNARFLMEMIGVLPQG